MASSRASFVCVRQKAVLFDSVTSYQSSSFAQPGEIFLTDSSRARVVDGFHMVPVDCGAVEAAFLRLASSTDLQLNPDLVVLDLSSRCIPRRKTSKPFKFASGPGCIPWNSCLRARLFSNLPLGKVVRKTQHTTQYFGSRRHQISLLQRCHPLCAWSQTFHSLPVSQRNQIAHAFLSTSLAFTISQMFFDQTMYPFVPGWLHRPLENGASQYCWWFSHADVAHQHPLSAMREARSHGVPLDVFGPVTDTRHIRLLVSAFSRLYPTGLLILHQPAGCCLLFLPSCPTQKLSFEEASQWLFCFPSTRAMFFTQPAGAVVGHFVGCYLKRAKSWSSSADNSRHRCFVRQSFPHSYQLCGCGVGDSVSAGGLDSESLAWTGENSTPCRDPHCQICFRRIPPASPSIDASIPAQQLVSLQDETPSSQTHATTLMDSSASSHDVSAGPSPLNPHCLSPTVSFSLDLPAPAPSTWFDPLRPSLTSQSVRRAWSSTADAAPMRKPSDQTLEFEPPVEMGLSSLLPQSLPEPARSAECGNDGVVSLPFFPKWLPKPVQHQSQSASAPLPFFPKWTPRQHRASLPFFPQWAPKAAPHPSSSNLPETVGGMVGSTPPPVCLSSTTYWNLLAVGVPPAIAREAARRHVDDFDAALDWACSSDRRHTRVGVPDCVDLVDSSSNASPPPGAASPNPVNLRVPASWLASPTIADAALAPHPESLDAAAPPPLPSVPPFPGSWVYSPSVLPGVSASADMRLATNTPALPAPCSFREAASEDLLNVRSEAEADPDVGARSVGLRCVGPPCYVDDPAAEVHSWFCLLANSCGSAGFDLDFWSRMPLYSQHIQERSLREIVTESLAAIQDLRGLDLSIDQAAKLPRCLGQTTLLPLAVAAEFLHEGCGFPAIFAFDLFQSCLASCQHKALEVALYAAKSKSFTCKARWWACPTGDPNAGKSPTCAFVMKAFVAMVKSLPEGCWPDQHWIGVGNNNRIQNRLRALDGTLLLYGPESKPILDPNFPTKKTVDTGKFLDLTRWLEAANGGRFEWGTGAEENERQKRKTASGPVTEPCSAPLVFDPTNINLCLFQQFNLFEDWWCNVEAIHKCGFSARVLMSPTDRAIVNRDVGLQDPTCVAKLMSKIWTHTVTHHGPEKAPSEPLCPSLLAQGEVRSLYYELHEEDQKGGWGSAMKSALGKMEYHVPTTACLTSLASWALSPPSLSNALSDNSIKCAVLHFALRLCQSCAVVDSTIRRIQARQKLPPAAHSLPSQQVRPLTARVLETCRKDPILETHLTCHFAMLRGADKRQDRLALLNELVRLGLGEIKEKRRRHGGEGRCVEFHRCPLSPTVSAALLTLNVPEALWPRPATLAPAPMPSDAVPPMHGAGKRARAQAAVQPEAPEAADHPDAKKGRGRPSAKEVDDLYSMQATLPCEQEQLSKADFLNQEKAWASSLVSDRNLRIKGQFAAHKKGFKVHLWCNSCDACQDRKGWKAICTYNRDEKLIHRKSTPIASHGDFNATRAWNPLTSTAEHALKQFVQANAHFSTQDLVKIVEKHQPDRPTDAFLQTWGKNHRVHKGSAKSRTSSFKWVESDWRQLERDLGSALDLEEAVNELKIAGLLLEREQTAIIFCNPMLLEETLHSLTNRVYIKLCGDGTFRLTEEDWVLMTVGVLSKHYSESEGVEAFRTAFHPLVFGLANKESQPTYQVLFEALCACAEKFAGVDLRSSCQQYHADMHPGEDLAQRSVFINASRVADWAHVIGACNRPKASKHLALGDERIKIFRSGAFATMQNNFTRAGQKLLPLVKRAFFCLRSVPTAMIFHSIAALLLQTLVSQQPPEEKAAKALQRHYLVKHGRQQAQANFKVEDWPGEQNTFYTAEWWCGLQRIQPGSASGTQAQESWHRWKLKKYLGLRSDLSSFSKNLADFTKSRLMDLRGEGSCLPDMPPEPFPDKTVLQDSNVLTRQGRSSADQYFRTRAWDRFDDADGTTFFCMRRTLATYDHASNSWKNTPDNAVPCPSSGFAQAFANLVRANSEACLIRALFSLGLAQPLLDLEKLLKLLDSYVLVAVGPFASQFWRRESLAGEANPHTQGFCAFCHEFCLHATCEHMHAAFLILGQLSLQRPVFPERSKPVPLFEQDPVEVLLPAALGGWTLSARPDPA